MPVGRDLPADLPFWLALAAIPGLGPVGQRKLLSVFGSPEAVFSASRASLAAHLKPEQLDALARGPDAKAQQPTLDWLADPANQVVTLADPDYPPLLLETADPPPVFFLKGRRALLGAPCFAVVGSRNATPQGLRDTEAFAASLSDAGLTVVSGLAQGIDGAAHRGALAGAGSTLAVVGTGLDIVYPARHRDLAHEIAQQGAILSEFPLGTKALAGHFPRRNRLISGLSLGCLVVEASLGSGSLITARLAAEQGREVFALPGSIHSPLSKGCHQLLKQGAKLVESARDILDELRWTPAARPAAGEMAGAKAAPASPLLACMGTAPLALDALVERSGLTADRVSAMLLALELEGWVAALPGGLYQRLHS
jgi:DNA processing protein